MAASSPSPAPMGDGNHPVSRDKLKTAFSAYHNDERFADFTVVCGDKKYRVHRCFIAWHSKWFERCCSGSFAESTSQIVELKEDLPEAVDRMMEYFYTFDYNDDLGIAMPVAYTEKKPHFPIQLHAHVYQLADKYEVPDLKALALSKFKKASLGVLNRPTPLRGAVWTIYKWLTLPESDRILKDTVVDMWVIGGTEFMRGMKTEIPKLFNTIPEFAVDLHLRMTDGYKTNQIKVECSSCTRQYNVTRHGVMTGDSSTVKCAHCGTRPIKSTVTVQSGVQMSKFW